MPRTVRPSLPGAPSPALPRAQSPARSLDQPVQPHAQPNQPSIRARDQWVDTAKGLSIVLVVLLHTSLWLRQADMERIEAFSTLNLAFEDLRMPLFFAMSGLFAAKWLRAGWRDLLRGKLALLAWVFLLWQIPIIAYRIIGGELLPGMVATDLPQQLETWAWSPLRANAELWFLWALVGFFLVGRLVRNVPTGVLLLAAAAVSVLWSGVLWQGVAGWEPGEIRHLLGTGFHQAPAYLVFFLAAARGSSLMRDGVARLPRTAWAAVAAGWFVAFVWLDVLDGHRDSVGVEFLGQVCGVIGGLALAVTLQSVPAVARGLAHLGRHTLEVYLSHTTIVVALACVLYLAGSPLLGAPWAAWTVVAVALTAIGLGLLLGRAAGRTWLLQAPAAVRRLAAAGRPDAARRLDVPR
ncbi:acyltransferase [Citricoccus sp. I39-566]|uniref:acyltransferase n=1 Tax=Citricoccus sp. I39-566 TaxID=3073268 RepID=UPI00286BA7EF|nr:acyltransferase [Citricoccus sp. I39-566]WMY78105.1 acyltransferase [Citricoccus sp. I39-566]